MNGTIADGSADFNPIPELSRVDGDLTITFLVGNSVIYTEKTIDPWYRGTVPGPEWTSYTVGMTSSQMAYTPEEAASPLGCLQKYQICNIDASHCGPLTGLFDYQYKSANAFNLSEEFVERSIFEEGNALGQRFLWFTGVMGYATTICVKDTLAQLGAFSLSSQNAMRHGVMAPLADNQWQLDVERWWAIGLASLQAGMVDVAVGPSDENLRPYTIPPPSSFIQDSFCNSQVSSLLLLPAPRRHTDEFVRH